MSSQITHSQLSNIHPLTLILDTYPLIFSSWAFFYSLAKLHYVMASHPSPGDCHSHQNTGGQSERTQGQVKLAALNSFSYICTRALNSFRSFALCHAASTVIPLLPKATFTLSIQPNLGFTFAINTLLAIHYPSILSICPNHLNTL